MPSPTTNRGRILSIGTSGDGAGDDGPCFCFEVRMVELVGKGEDSTATPGRAEQWSHIGEYKPIATPRTKKIHFPAPSLSPGVQYVHLLDIAICNWHPWSSVYLNFESSLALNLGQWQALDRNANKLEKNCLVAYWCDLVTVGN